MLAELQQVGATSMGSGGNDFDVVIAGASFAGLTVANGISGRVLVLDKKKPGTHQTSACGTFLGEIIQEVLDGRLSLDEGLQRYSRFVARKTWRYGFLRRAQHDFLRRTNRIFAAMGLLNNRIVCQMIQRAYLAL